MTKKKCLGCQWKHCPPPNMFMFKCLLNQGSKALEPPRTHQAESGVGLLLLHFVNKSPPKKYLCWPVIPIAFWSFNFCWQAFVFPNDPCMFCFTCTKGTILSPWTPPKIPVAFLHAPWKKYPMTRLSTTSPRFPTPLTGRGWEYLWTSPIEPGGLLGMKDLRIGYFRICVKKSYAVQICILRYTVFFKFLQNLNWLRTWKPKVGFECSENWKYLNAIRPRMKVRTIARLVGKPLTTEGKQEACIIEGAWISLFISKRSFWILHQDTPYRRDQLVGRLG